MEPHSNIAHSKEKHIDIYVKPYVFYVPMWLKYYGLLYPDSYLLKNKNALLLAGHLYH